MSHSDRQLMNALREVIATEIIQQIEIVVDAKVKNHIDQITEASTFNIQDYRDDIETMISEHINYNVTVTIEG